MFWKLNGSEKRNWNLDSISSGKKLYAFTNCNAHSVYDLSTNWFCAWNAIPFLTFEHSSSATLIICFGQIEIGQHKWTERNGMIWYAKKGNSFKMMCSKCWWWHSHAQILLWKWNAKLFESYLLWQNWVWYCHKLTVKMIFIPIRITLNWDGFDILCYFGAICYVINEYICIFYNILILSNYSNLNSVRRAHNSHFEGEIMTLPLRATA